MAWILTKCQVLANLLALAAVCPYVGSLSDLMGRRYVAILGACLIILGMIVASTAHSMNIFIGENKRLTGAEEQWLIEFHRRHGHSGRGSRYQ